MRSRFSVITTDKGIVSVGKSACAYDPRLGQKTNRFSTNILLFIQRVLNFFLKRIRYAIPKEDIFKIAYDKIGFDKELKNTLYDHPIFRVNENCVFHPHLIRSFTYFSVLYKYCKGFNEKDTVLEIGAGAGLMGILLTYEFNVKYIIVDLPELLEFSSSIIKTYLPHSKNFTFITPEEMNVIQNKSISLSINTRSFMEMTKEEIDKYFKLIQKVTKGYFFTENRYKKVPGLGDTKERVFFDYPWDKENKDVFIEISELSLEVKNHIFIQRLQEIK